MAILLENSIIYNFTAGLGRIFMEKHTNTVQFFQALCMDFNSLRIWGGNMVSCFYDEIQAAFIAGYYKNRGSGNEGERI